MANKVLLFQMQDQQGDNWCWAANAASISYFYNNSTQWTQCIIATQYFIQYQNAISPDCCPPRPQNPWDLYGRLDYALTITQNFVPPYQNALLFPDIQQQIDLSRIIGVEITWPDGGGNHFLSIYGYDDSSGSPFVFVGDPEFPISNAISLDYLTTNYYQPDSSWSYTFLTTSNIADSLEFSSLKFSSLNSRVIKTAHKIKPDEEKRRLEKLTIKVPVKTSRLFPHTIYCITFRSLQSDSPQIVRHGFRVLNPGRRKMKYLADFSSDHADAVLQQVILDQGFIKKYLDLWKEIILIQHGTKQKFTLNLIRQPELNVEAFWIQQDNPMNQNEYILINGFSLFSQSSMSYSQVQFFEMLKKAAAAKKTNPDKLVGG